MYGLHQNDSAIVLNSPVEYLRNNIVDNIILNLFFYSQPSYVVLIITGKRGFGSVCDCPH